MPAYFAIRLISAEATYPLRHQVLWPDKPLEYVKIEEDATGLHFGAFVAEAEPAAVVSLFVTGTEARFRKFATRPDWQRQGLGSALLQHTFAQARQRDATTIWCDARQDAAAFYTKFGMKEEGSVFYKGPVPYVRMRGEL